MVCFKIATFSLPVLEVQGDFSLIFTLRTSRVLGGKTHKKSVIPGDQDCIPLEFLTQTYPHLASNNSSILVEVFLSLDLFP